MRPLNKHYFLIGDCEMKIKKDLVGQKFGRLLVQSYAGKDKRNTKLWNCLCDCGNQTIVRYGSLISGGTQSCGCLRRERASEANKKHGLSGTPTYQKWSDMKKRCRNPKSKLYPQYGGAGITMDDYYLKFENFFADLGECPPGLTLDRIDPYKGYIRGNLRWATRKTQSINRKHIKQYTMNGETKTVKDWSKKWGISAATLMKKIKEGYSLQAAYSIIAIRTRETLL